jgi:hypothetical protein
MNYRLADAIGFRLREDSRRIRRSSKGGADVRPGGAGTAAACPFHAIRERFT